MKTRQKQTTTATATRTPPNKMLKGENNSIARDWEGKTDSRVLGINIWVMNNFDKRYAILHG